MNTRKHTLLIRLACLGLIFVDGLLMPSSLRAGPGNTLIALACAASATALFCSPVRSKFKV